MKNLPPPLLLERKAWSAGHRRVAGIDEAGRGPLAGPVVAAAVCIEATNLEELAQTSLLGLTDSKKLSAARREKFFEILTASSAITYGVGQVSAEEIDRINILNATHLAMRRALETLRPPVELVLVDGLPVPGLPTASEAIVKGDALSALIAAASIIAKVTRDRQMDELDARHPQYGFKDHKGYGTAAHLEAIRVHGPIPEHRRSFAPIRDAARS